MKRVRLLQVADIDRGYAPYPAMRRMALVL